jgi:hypothetical protein
MIRLSLLLGLVFYLLLVFWLHHLLIGVPIIHASWE